MKVYHFETSPRAFGYIFSRFIFVFTSTLYYALIVCTILTKSPVTISAFFFFAVSGRFALYKRFLRFFSCFAASSGSSRTAPSSVYRKNTLCFSGGTKGGCQSPNSASSSSKMLEMASLTLLVAAASQSSSSLSLKPRICSYFYHIFFPLPSFYQAR